MQISATLGAIFAKMAVNLTNGLTIRILTESNFVAYGSNSSNPKE